jgi:hypothetical protein
MLDGPTPLLLTATAAYVSTPLDPPSDAITPPFPFAGDVGNKADPPAYTPPPSAFAAASKLPDVEDFKTTGVLDPSQAPKMYQVPIDESTGSIEVRYQPNPGPEPPGPPPFDEQLVLMDDSGRKLGWTDPNDASKPLDLSLRLDGMPRLSSVYVMLLSVQNGSSLPLDVSSNYQSNTFVLEVSRQPSHMAMIPPEAASAAASLTSDLNAGGSQGDAPNRPAAVRETEATDAEELGAAPLAGSVGAGPRPTIVATGPMPARSAAALGGILADDEPTPAIDRASAPLVDLDLIPREGDGHEAEDEGGLVAVRGPGGIPLLTTALIGIPHPGLRPKLAPTPAPASTPPPEVSADAAPTPAFSKARGRASAATGASIALSLIAGVIFSDLTIVRPLAPSSRRRLGIARLLRWARRIKIRY